MKMIKRIELIYPTFFSKKVSISHITSIMIIIAVITGCGYSSKSLISHNISSIYIPIFDNTTFRRGLEFDLTKAVKNEIMSRTNLRIAEKEIADTILYGQINNVTENVLIQNRRDDIVESTFTIFVDIKLVDRRTGRTLVEKSSLHETAEFVVNRGENINSAADEGLVQLAETIVSNLEEMW